MSTKSSFAVIDRAAQATVAYELGEAPSRAELSRLGIRPQRTRSIAGLSVVSNAARDAAINSGAAESLARLKQYRADREQVKKQLEDAGVSPLAVLPLSAWERICEKAKLYRFTPNQDSVRFDASSILADAEVLTKKQSENDSMPGLLALAILVSILGSAIAGGHYGGAFVSSMWQWHSAFGSVPGFLIAGTISLVVNGFFYDNMPGRKKSMKAREASNIRNVVQAKMRDGTLFQKIWPNYREPAEGKSVRIVLPPAPVRVQERLLKAERAGLELRLAAVGDAIALHEDLSDIVIGLRAKEWEVHGRELMLKYDPIVYVVHGTAVAVLDQFGDFPIEKDVVNEVINSEHFI